MISWVAILAFIFLVIVVAQACVSFAHHRSYGSFYFGGDVGDAFMGGLNLSLLANGAPFLILLVFIGYLNGVVGYTISLLWVGMEFALLYFFGRKYTLEQIPEDKSLSAHYRRFFRTGRTIWQELPAIFSHVCLAFYAGLCCWCLLEAGEFIGVPRVPFLLLMVAFVASITAFGGHLSVRFATSFFGIAGLSVLGILCLAVVASVGGVESLSDVLQELAKTSPNLKSWHGGASFFAILMVPMAALGYYANPQTFLKFTGIHSRWELIFSSGFSLALNLLSTLTAVTLGLYARRLIPMFSVRITVDPASLFTALEEYIFNTPASALLLALGFICLLLSTLFSTYYTVGHHVTQDLVLPVYRRYLKKRLKIGDSKIIRLTYLLLGLYILCFAFMDMRGVRFAFYAWFFAAVPFLGAAIYWQLGHRTPSTLYLVGTVAGLMCYFPLQLVGVFSLLPPMLPAAFCSLLAMLVVEWLYHRRKKRTEQDRLTRVREARKKEENPWKFARKQGYARSGENQEQATLQQSRGAFARRRNK